MDQRTEQRVQSCPPAQHQPVLVVGYDRHPAAQRALRAAADLAVLLQADVVVAHVLDAEDYPIDSDAADWEEHAEHAVAEQNAQVTALLAGHPLPWTFQTDHGAPAQRLLELATNRHALMIIIGTARPRWGAHLLTGSVAKHLSRHADRPFLLVPCPPRP